MQQLLSRARQDAERAAPAVQCAALLHIARVLTKIDRTEAERTLDEALDLAATLSDGEREVLLGEGAALAATVSPQRAFDLIPHLSLDRDGILTRALFNMLEHGFVAEAAAYLGDAIRGEAYPFHAALQAMGRGTDDETRLHVFRGAIRAMREDPSSNGHGRFRRDHDFIRLFTRHWTRLPAAEARAVVRELLERILSEPDSRTNASFASGSHRVQFSSTHEQRLFEILGPLRHLDPERAESVVRSYADLAAAAARYPYGRESMDAAMHAELPPATSRPIEQPDYIDVGQRLIPIPEAIRTEFKDAFALALNLYGAENDSANFNEAPQECWASAFEFRKILYKAGRHEGPAAERYLERIPDLALRLLAQVELAAALAGLPPLGGRSIRPGPRGLGAMVAESRRETSPQPAAPPPMRVLPPTRKPNLAPSLEARIVPATLSPDEGPSGGTGPDFVEIRNASLGGVIAQLTNTPHVRIDWPSTLDLSARYDFTLVLPHAADHDTRMRLLQDGIARHFQFSITTELQPRDVYVVTAPNGIRTPEALLESGWVGGGSFGSISIGEREPHAMMDAHPRIPEAIRLQEIMDGPMMSDEALRSPDGFAQIRRRIMRQLAATLSLDAWIGGIEASLTMQELCDTIEDGLDRPLLDETNLPGTYAISVQTKARTTLDFLRVLCDRLGLTATSARRDVRMLVIRLA
jgi:uncharacterized protein (TIGR03435 family)